MIFEHPTDHELLLVETADGHKASCSCGWRSRYWLANSEWARRVWHKHMQGVRQEENIGS